tara:strand:+ start:1088 stop:1327 length:240 start_codon:yes stop_codon:yes gene_type:complete
MSWEKILKISDEHLKNAVKEVFSEAKNNVDAERVLNRLFGKDRVKPFISDYYKDIREQRSHGKVIEGGASKGFTHQRGR